MKSSQLLLGLLLLLFYSCAKDSEVEIDEVVLIDENGLYTDAGLEYPIDASAVNVPEQWISGVKKYAQPIRSLTSVESFEDLEFFSNVLSTKKMIQIGESGHGVKQYNQIKTRLIKYLHQELDFNVLAFESSLFECYYAYLNSIQSPDKSARDAIENSILEFWHTKEIEDLFIYIKETYESNNPLILAGIDIQASSKSMDQRPLLFKEIISLIDPDYAEEIFSIDKEVNENLFNSESTFFDDVNDLVDTYDNLAIFLRNNKDVLDERYFGTREELHPIIAEQTARSMSILFRRINARRNDLGQRSFEIRDKAMADNISFLKKDVFPDSKIMIWAHNFHIRHDNPAVNGDYLDGYVNMGEFLKRRYQNELYTLGLFMHSGSAAANNRMVYDIEPNLPNSLESIMHRTGIKHSFLDFSAIPNNDETSWIFRPSFNKAWGLINLEMVVKDQYDGIIFIQKVSPPEYLQ